LGLTYPPIQWLPRALTPGGKRPWSQAVQSPQSSAEFKNTWSYTSTLPIIFVGFCLIKQEVCLSGFLFSYAQEKQVGLWNRNELP